MKGIISAVFLLQVSLIAGQVSIFVKNSCPETVNVYSDDNSNQQIFDDPVFNHNDWKTASLPDGYVGYIYGYNASNTAINPDGVTRVQFNVPATPTDRTAPVVPTVYYVMTDVGGGMNYNLTVTPSNVFFGCGVTYVAAGPNDGYTGQNCTTYTSDGFPVSAVGNVATQLCYPNPTPIFPGGSSPADTTSYLIEFCGPQPQQSSCASSEDTETDDSEVSDGSTGN